MRSDGAAADPTEAPRGTLGVVVRHSLRRARWPPPGAGSSHPLPAGVPGRRRPPLSATRAGPAPSRWGSRRGRPGRADYAAHQALRRPPAATQSNVGRRSPGPRSAAAGRGGAALNGPRAAAAAGLGLPAGPGAAAGGSAGEERGGGGKPRRRGEEGNPRPAPGSGRSALPREAAGHSRRAAAAAAGAGPGRPGRSSSAPPPRCEPTARFSARRRAVNPGSAEPGTGPPRAAAPARGGGAERWARCPLRSRDRHKERRSWQPIPAPGGAGAAPAPRQHRDPPPAPGFHRWGRGRDPEPPAPSPRPGHRGSCGHRPHRWAAKRPAPRAPSAPPRGPIPHPPQPSSCSLREATAFEDGNGRGVGSRP